MLCQEVSAIFFLSENTTKIKVYFQLSFLKRKKKKTEGPKKHLLLLVFGEKFCVEYAYVSEGVFLRCQRIGSSC